MDGISRSAGVGPTITLGGRQLTTRGKILEHYAEIEAEYIKRRGNPFEMARMASSALKGDSESDNTEFVYGMISRMFDEAKKWQIVTINEMLDWLETTWAGRCMHIWLAVRHNDPSLTLDEVTRLFMRDYESIRIQKGAPKAEEWMNDIYQAIRQSEGEDELGNSNGSPPSENEDQAASESSPGT